MPINNAVTRWLARKLYHRLERVTHVREPDFVIGRRDDPYLLRWHLIPRNPVVNIYLHEFQSDDPNAPHCHPWASLSLSLSRRVHEVYLERRYNIVVRRRRDIYPGDLVYRRAKFAHRLVIPNPGALTLFITGPRIRTWGFHCENRRFVPWHKFVDDRQRGIVGRGCD